MYVSWVLHAFGMCFVLIIGKNERKYHQCIASALLTHVAKDAVLKKHQRTRTNVLQWINGLDQCPSHSILEEYVLAHVQVEIMLTHKHKTTEKQTKIQKNNNNKNNKNNKSNKT